MNNRDLLLIYAQRLSDQRVHRVVGKCIAEYSHQGFGEKNEPTTSTVRTTFASFLHGMSDDDVKALLRMALGMEASKGEFTQARDIMSELCPEYLHMVRVFAQSLLDAQTAIKLPQEVSTQ